MDDQSKENRQLIASTRHRLAIKRRNWFLGIWAGYSVLSFILLRWINQGSEQLLGTVLAAIVLGLLLWYVNSIVWTNACADIDRTRRHLEKMEKEIYGYDEWNE